MVFSSLLFIYGFLPVSILVYRLTPKKIKNQVLLLLSILFCAMAGFRYLVFVLIFALWNFIMAKSVEKLRKSKALSAFPLAIGIIGDLASMLVFRTEYFSEVTDKIGFGESFFPVGISFLTLSAIGSLIDTYTGKTGSKTTPLTYLLYIVFFPKLFMGPIISYRGFSKMVLQRKESLALTGTGLSLFVTGLAKRIILAESFYTLYSSVKSIDTGELSALTAWLGLIAYIMCLYFTLSGYSDMGAGVACCFGFRLPQSFRYPLFSMGIKDFANKWHRPVVSWFERYIYNPLSSAVKKKQVRYMFLILTWGIIGLWYRFSLNTVIWGLIIGISAVIEKMTYSSNRLKSTSIVYTVLILSLGTAFFVGDSISESFMYTLAMLGGNSNLADQTGLYLLRSYGLLIAAGLIIASGAATKLTLKSHKKVLKRAALLVLPLVNILLLLISTAFISYSGTADIILLQL